MTYHEIDDLIASVREVYYDYGNTGYGGPSREDVINDCRKALPEMKAQMQAAQELIRALLPGGLGTDMAATEDGARVARAIAAYRAVWRL